MAKTDDGEGLLRACLQDLHADKRLLASHLPALARSASDPPLRAWFEGAAAATAEQADRLEETGLARAGPANLWMTGILRDGRRDTRSIVPGPLLDIALVGAVRKAFAAGIVSDETAIAVAEMIGEADAAAIISEIRNEQQAADRSLATFLAPLAEAAAAHPPRHRPSDGAFARNLAVVALASLVTGWTYWALQDRAQARRTRERLTGQEHP